MQCTTLRAAHRGSRLSLDAFNEPMDEGHGVWQTADCGSKAADAGVYDIQPGNAAQSILPYRVASTEPGIAMPPFGAHGRGYRVREPAQRLGRQRRRRLRRSECQ